MSDRKPSHPKTVEEFMALPEVSEGAKTLGIYIERGSIMAGVDGDNQRWRLVGVDGGYARQRAMFPF